MSSAFEAMQPFVEWCDTPPPTDLRQAHILRALLEPNDNDPNVGARLFPFYWGTLVFARRQSRPQFQGIALAAADISDSDLGCIKMQLDLFPAGTVAATLTVCEIGRTFGAGRPIFHFRGRHFRPFEATDVQERVLEFPHEELKGHFFLIVEGSKWGLALRNSTVSGIET